MNALLHSKPEPRIVAGSVDPVINRTTKQIVGYRGRLPRSMSTPPKSCKNPDKFRQWVTPLCATRAEAIEILNAAVHEIKTLGSLVKGLTFADYAKQDIDERYQQSRRRVDHHASANKRIQSWRNITKNWLPKAHFWEWPPSAITNADCQAFVQWLVTKARIKGGAPLGNNTIRNVAQQLKAVLKRAKIKPNPASELELPPRNEPKCPHMTLESQRRFFACEDVSLEDRVMTGIGMGLGVRIGELLALEASQIVFTSEGRGYVLLEFGGDNHSPLKGKGGNKKRRVELFEPGLGFLKVWMRDYYKGGERVFEGPNGGYLSAWATRFAGWSKHAGCKMHSHMMRHSYAVAMLSGSWGYPKKPLEFVQHQLGHTEIRTTERYYADYAEGTWARDVDAMTGAVAPEAAREIITAEALLSGKRGLSSGPSGNGKPPTKPEQIAKTEPDRADRWSSVSFPGTPEETAKEAAHNRPLHSVALPGRFSPRRRRRTGGAA